MKSIFWSFIILTSFVGCGKAPEEVAFATNEAQTATASAWTATPTNTPKPTSTPTPTLTPTQTPTPMPTPLGASSGKIIFWQPAINKTGNNKFDRYFWSLALYELQSRKVSVIGESDGLSDKYIGSSVSISGEFIYLFKEEINETSRGPKWNDLLYEYNLETGEMRCLSIIPEDSGKDPAEYLLMEYYPDISHDGQMLIFNSTRDSVYSYNPSDYLYTMDLATNDIKLVPDTVYRAFRARFSPDGNKIAYSAWDGDWEVYIQNLDGTGLQKITNNRNPDRYPEWSPDGEKIVFHSNRDGNYELYVYDLITAETTRITSDPAIDATGSWSPDGTMILFTSNREGDTDIYSINVETLEVNKIYNSDNNLGMPIWVP
jgi:hypothetical protein